LAQRFEKKNLALDDWFNEMAAAIVCVNGWLTIRNDGKDFGGIS
jgi:hypothetical protein